MPASKKNTQHVFDGIADDKTKNSYGYLGLAAGIAAEITRLRQAKGWAQIHLAEKSGIARPTINKIESCMANPTLYQLIKIAHALDMKMCFEPMTIDEIRDWKDVDMESFME